MSYNNLIEFEVGNINGNRNGRYIKLGLSESPYGMCSTAQRILLEEIKNSSFYPDSNYEEFKGVLAKKYGVSTESIFISNGIDELLLLSALSFKKENSIGLVNEATFNGHKNSLNIAGVEYRSVKLVDYKVCIDEFIKNMDKRTSIVYICNPHNPTGTAIKASNLERLIELAEKNGTVVIVDEAYAEYADSNTFDSAIKYVKAGSPVVVLRTFSKIHGMAGLRCGYAIGNEGLIKVLHSVKDVLPYNVNKLVSKAAICSIENQQFVNTVKEKNNKVKNWVYKELDKLDLSYIKSETNFVSIKTLEYTKKICNILEQKYKILIKNAELMGLDGYIRVSIGTQEEMEIFIRCLKWVLKEVKET